MNYLSLYKSIIRKAKLEQKTRLFNKKNNLEYYEEHHGIPQCVMLIRKPWLKPTRYYKDNLMNRPWNLVLLTAREHFIAHLVLLKWCSQKYGRHHLYTEKLLHSVNMLSNLMEGKETGYKISSRIYEYLRKERNRVGRSEEHCGAISKSVMGVNNHMFGKCGELHHHFGKHASAKNWKIYFNDGRIEIVYLLGVWCKTNNYRYNSIIRVHKGTRCHYRDIIKVEKLN